MATQVQFRRGTASEHTGFTGVVGELTVNTTNKSAHIHDGSTAGGFELAKVNLSNASNITGLSVSGIVTATDFNSTSDINLKTNIKPIESALDKVVKINGVTFNWKENNEPSIGVIAQEVETVFPEIVKHGEHKKINYNGLIGVLIESIKDQQKQINELKVELQDLKNLKES